MKIRDSLVITVALTATIAGAACSSAGDVTAEPDAGSTTPPPPPPPPPEVCSLQSCATGCCSGTTCESGNEVEACGGASTACVNCNARGTYGVCTNQVCDVDEASRWDLLILDASLPIHNLENQNWDPGGLPDAHVTVMIETATPGTFTTRDTTTVNDSITPKWNELVFSNVTARQLEVISFKMMDTDGNADDKIGFCAATLGFAEFDGQTNSVTCPRSSANGNSEFTIRYQVRPH